MKSNGLFLTHIIKQWCENNDVELYHKIKFQALSKYVIISMAFLKHMNMNFRV